MSRLMVTEHQSAHHRRIPKFVLPILTTILVLGFTPLMFFTCHQLVTDWRTVASEGVVVGIRTVKIDPPLPKARGPWHVIWEVECGEGGAERISVTAPGSYVTEGDAREAARNDTGRRATVWYVPGSGNPGDLSPPDVWRNRFAAFWSTALAAVGWIGVVGYVQLAWRKKSHRVSSPKLS